MSEHSSLLDRVAAQRISERVARNAGPRLPQGPRPRGRHGLAQRLHALADRLDA